MDSEGGGVESLVQVQEESVGSIVRRCREGGGESSRTNGGARRFNRVRTAMALALLLASGSLAAPASQQPPRPLQEVYPVFWAVGGNVRQEAPFQANGSVDLPRFGIKMNNWTICGGWTAINHSRAEAFPSLDDDGTVHNGGVPQAMNTSYFLQMLSINIAEKIPDPNWAGLGVFECVQASPAARCRRSVLDCTEVTDAVSLWPYDQLRKLDAHLGTEHRGQQLARQKVPELLHCTRAAGSSRLECSADSCRSKERLRKRGD